MNDKQRIADLEERNAELHAFARNIGYDMLKDEYREHIASMERVVDAARAFVKAVDSDEQIAAVSGVALNEWVDLADAVLSLRPPDQPDGDKR